MRAFGLVLVPFVILCHTIQAQSNCRPIGGVLMTNIGAIDGTTNLGPVFGDLQGSVAAKIVSQNRDGTFTIQHYWVTATGDSIYFKPAILKPVGTSDPNVVAVLWPSYRAEFSGGTGVYERSSGYIDCFGLADFKALTLVLRFRGEICTRP